VVGPADHRVGLLAPHPRDRGGVWKMFEPLLAAAVLAAMIGVLRALDHLFLGHPFGRAPRCWWCGGRR
jgi:hypothetical protein